MSTRRDFLQILGLGGMVAAVHNVDALGISCIEKKLIVPNIFGLIKIYSGSPDDGVLLATLEMHNPATLESPITGPVIATGTASWARIRHPEYGVYDMPIGREEDNKPMSFDNTEFITGGQVDIHSLALTPKDFSRRQIK